MKEFNGKNGVLGSIEVHIYLGCCCQGTIKKYPRVNVEWDGMLDISGRKEGEAGPQILKDFSNKGREGVWRTDVDRPF